MITDNMRAYCPECKRMVSDDIVDGKNMHEHSIVVMRVVQSVEPGTKVLLTELTPAAYLKEASRLDAELIVGRIMSRYNIPLPRNIFRSVIEEILRILREVAIEEEKKERAKLLDKKLAKLAEGKSKPKAKPKKETLT